jgi:hypothetical protein
VSNFEPTVAVVRAGCRSVPAAAPELGERGMHARGDERGRLEDDDAEEASVKLITQPVHRMNLSAPAAVCKARAPHSHPEPVVSAGRLRCADHIAKAMAFTGGAPPSRHAHYRRPESRLPTRQRAACCGPARARPSAARPIQSPDYRLFLGPGTRSGDYFSIRPSTARPFRALACSLLKAQAGALACFDRRWPNLLFLCDATFFSSDR